MNIVKFTETVFSSKGKKGNLTPDSDGYYTVVLGALNTYNSAGEYYTAEDAVNLFENSSHLMRRIKNGVLYSELGHPKKLPGMSLDQFYNRILTIEETNVCGHISEVSLDFNYGKDHPELNNSDMIAIIGKVKPAGSKANALQIALENPKQNIAFSVRGLTDNRYRNGRVERTLTNIVTWDYVIEPGINIATKAHSPGLESISKEEYSVTEILNSTVNTTILKNLIKKNMQHVCLEDSNNIYNDILSRLEKSTKYNISQW